MFLGVSSRECRVNEVFRCESAVQASCVNVQEWLPSFLNHSFEEVNESTFWQTLFIGLSGLTWTWIIVIKFKFKNDIRAMMVENSSVFHLFTHSITHPLPPPDRPPARLLARSLILSFIHSFNQTNLSLWRIRSNKDTCILLLL